MDAELRQLAADLDNAGGRVTKKAKQVVARSAADLEREAKRTVQVDTGATRSSIGVDLSADGLSATIGPTTNYAPPLETGTRRMRAYPFMGPAAEIVEPRFAAAIEKIGGEFLD